MLWERDGKVYGGHLKRPGHSPCGFESRRSYQERKYRGTVVMENELRSERSGQLPVGVQVPRPAPKTETVDRPFRYLGARRSHGFLRGRWQVGTRDKSAI